MKRAVLDSYIGKNVSVTLFDDDMYSGILGFADDFSALHGFKKPGYFYIGHMCFKSSHVKKLSEAALVEQSSYLGF